MCLDTVEFSKVEDIEKEREGWKVFIKRYDLLNFPYLQYNKSGAVPTNQWIEAEKSRLSGAWGTEFYTSGFHVFTRREDAERWASIHFAHLWAPDNTVIVKVKVKNVHTYGLQSNLRVLVADYMFVEHGTTTNPTPDQT